MPRNSLLRPWTAYWIGGGEVKYTVKTGSRSLVLSAEQIALVPMLLKMTSTRRKRWMPRKPLLGLEIGRGPNLRAMRASKKLLASIGIEAVSK
jgi:hypothetical protein